MPLENPSLASPAPARSSVTPALVVRQPTSRTPAGVVVLAENPLLRVALRSIMGSHPGIDVLGDFASLRQVPTGTPGTRPDILLLEVDQLHEQFRTAYGRLTHEANDRGIAIVAIMEPDDQSALRTAMLFSARGFVDRNASQADLCTAVLNVHDGRMFLSSTIAEVLVGWVATRINREPVSLPEIERALTERELQVLLALGAGVTNTAIARLLHIQEATVRSHVYHLINKLNLRTRTEAVLAGHNYANTLRDHSEPA